MNKSILGLAITTFLSVGAAQATVMSSDTGATLSISGIVIPPPTGCVVTSSVSSTALNADVSGLKGQNEIQSPQDMSFIDLQLTGPTCATEVAAGRIGYTFKGATDKAFGVSLANEATGDGAATGVGVGLFNSLGEVLAPNVSTLLATPGVTSFGINLVRLNNQEPTPGKIQSFTTIQIERL